MLLAIHRERGDAEFGKRPQNYDAFLAAGLRPPERGHGGDVGGVFGQEFRHAGLQLGLQHPPAGPVLPGDGPRRAAHRQAFLLPDQDVRELQWLLEGRGNGRADAVREDRQRHPGEDGRLREFLARISR